MKKSPLSLSSPEYPVISLRAIPTADEAKLAQDLPVMIEGIVGYDADGSHFAMVSIKQTDDSFAYTFEITCFTTFTMDVDGCKNSYGEQFNPAVVAVNVARILYAGAREMLSVVSSRSPHGTALLPSVIIEPNDIKLEFEEGKRDEILKAYFAFSDEKLEELQKAIIARQASSSKKPKSGGAQSAKKATKAR